MHPVLLVDRPHEPADLGSHDPLHRDRLGRDDVHLQLPRPQRGGDFEPDKAGADDHRAARRRGLRDDGAAVGERAQIVDMREIAAGQVEAHRVGAGRDQEPVVVVTAAVLKLEAAARAVDRRDAGAEMQFDPVLAIEFRRA